MGDRAVTLLEQLELHEGRRRFPYKDTVGKWTIGIGRNLSDKGLRDDEIEYLLTNDVRECIDDLDGFSWFAGLDPVRRNVVIDMRFNLGPSRFRGFKRLLAALDRKDYLAAAGSMRSSKWATQVKRRATRLIQMMATGQP